MFVYLPAAKAARLALRVSVCSSGSAMLLWPPQYQTSPKITFCAFATAWPPALHVAVAAIV